MSSGARPPRGAAAGAAVLLLGALATPTILAGGAVHVVLVLEDRFHDLATGSPLTAGRVGDVVEFRLVSGVHTATRGVAALSLAGLGGPDSPILADAGETYTYALAEPGAVPYTCLLHAAMEGVLLAT